MLPFQMLAPTQLVGSVYRLSFIPSSTRSSEIVCVLEVWLVGASSSFARPRSGISASISFQPYTSIVAFVSCTHL